MKLQFTNSNEFSGATLCAINLLPYFRQQRIKTLIAAPIIHLRTQNFKWGSKEQKSCIKRIAFRDML